MGIRLSEMSARASLSELRLDDGECAGYETPRHGFRSLHEKDGERVWGKQCAGQENERQDMMVDDDE